MLALPEPGQPGTKQLRIEEVADPDTQWLLHRLGSPTSDIAHDFDPKMDTPFAQSNLEGGAGQLLIDARADDNRYWWGENIVTHTGGKTYLAPAAADLTLPTGAGQVLGFYSWVSSGGTRYDFCWQGSGLFRRDASNATNAWVKVWAETNGNFIYDFKVFAGGGYMAVPGVTDAQGGDFYYQADPTAAATWAPTLRNHTAFTDAVGKPKYFLAVRSTLYSFVNNNKVFYTTSPTTDSWTGPIDSGTPALNTTGRPGNGAYPFNGVQAAGDYLIAFNYDSGFSIDNQQDVSEVIWQWRDKPHANNFLYSTVGDNLVFFSIHNEVYGYDPATGRTASLRLSKQDGFSTQVIRGVGAYNQFVFTLADVRVPNIRASAIVALIRSVRVGAQNWAHEIVWMNASTGTYDSLGVCPQGTAGVRCYMGKGSATTRVDFPADWDESSGSSFATSGTLYASIVQTGFANFQKRHLWVGTYTEGCDASNTIAIAYSTDNGTNFTTLGTISSNGVNLTQFSNVSSQSIVLRFSFVSAGTATPILRVFDLHDRVRFRYLRKVTAAIRVADYLELRNGTRDTLTASTIQSNIGTLRATDTEIIYTDIMGNSFPVSIDSVAWILTDNEDADGMGAATPLSWEATATVVMPEANKGT